MYEKFRAGLINYFVCLYNAMVLIRPIFSDGSFDCSSSVSYELVLS